MKNESAFPSPGTPHVTPPAFGLTKREFYAAMAMQGMLTNPNCISDPAEASDWATRYADALLAALEITEAGA